MPSKRESGILFLFVFGPRYALVLRSTVSKGEVRAFATCSAVECEEKFRAAILCNLVSGIVCSIWCGREKQIKMNHQKLEAMIMEELGKEAHIYRPTKGTKSQLIEAISTHLEKCGSTCSHVEGAPSTTSDQSGGKTAVQLTTDRPGPSGKVQQIADGERPVSKESMQQLLAAIIASMQKQHEEACRQQQLFLQQQQEQFAQLIRVLSATRDSVESGGRGAADIPSEEEIPANRIGLSGQTSPSRDPSQARSIESTSASNAVTWIAAQIPEFSGSEDDIAIDTIAWTSRRDKIAQDNVSDGCVTLLAASSRLTKLVRKWYDIQTDAVLESWQRLKQEILKVFDIKIPFHEVMQKVEARKWNQSKETFDQYVIDKLALMHRLQMSEQDTIQLLIDGINQNALKAAALSVQTDSLNVFMDRMRHVTQEVADTEEKIINTPTKAKDNTCRNCGKKGHSHKECRAEVQCFYCKEKGHRRGDCPALKKKEAKSETRSQSSTTITAASVSEESTTTTTVAAVQGIRLIVNDPYVKVTPK